jgi:deoxyribodipyrimidine photo-lyase
MASPQRNGPACILWFRNDLRIEDNPALDAALAHGGPIIPVYIWAPQEEKPWSPGAASRWWLHQSLRQLDSELRRHGSRLILRQGTAYRELLLLATQIGADTVIWSRRYEPAIIKRDAIVESKLESAGIKARTVNASLLAEPWELMTKQERPYQVFAPFHRRLLEHNCGTPLPAPGRIRGPSIWPDSLDLRDLRLEPAADWAAGIRATWQPGERGARRALHQFIESALYRYASARDRPDLPGTSHLSPHLHFGEIGPRTIWNAVRENAATDTRNGAAQSEEAFLRQLAWREFSYHLLYHFPDTPLKPLKANFERFPWQTDRRALQAWQQGRTGYPFVDAGMRELWTTGWMHNRARLNAASFLVKHLLLPWQRGEKWFWDTLVDADLANNTMGWQWVAGSGADAAPYFRVFNPIMQGVKFDPDGDYVRRWVPELAALPPRWIHQPWKAPENVLRAARIYLGRTYPLPIVDHDQARRRALDAYENFIRPR